MFFRISQITVIGFPVAGLPATAQIFQKAERISAADYLTHEHFPNK